jgi:DNA-binding winged helix-turn-helix (wHTH) protein
LEFLGISSGYPVRVTFGDCLFDSETRQLFREGRQVHLSPKAFRLLETLLEGRPRALSKAEIHAKIWPDAFVSEVTLASLIAEIRDAIGEEDPKDARFIRTVHGFGYAFAGAASDVPARASPAGDSRWKVVWDGREIPLPEGETILGRGHLSRIRIASENVSRRHARILVTEDAVTVEDLGSTNGVYVGDDRIQEARRLRDGDSIRIGPATLTLRQISESEITKAELESSDIEIPPPTSPRRRRKRDAL